MQRTGVRACSVVLLLAVFCGCEPGAQWDPAAPAGGPAPLFQFVQLSDLHLGKSSPQPEDNLRHAVEQIGALQADFALLTGDLTDHGRAAEYETLKQILAALPVPWHGVPGDNDILDGEGDLARYREEMGADYGSFEFQGFRFAGDLARYREEMGADYGSFEFQGFRFAGVNNVLDPTLGEEQLLWLEGELASGQPAVVFGHKALLDPGQGFEPYPNFAPLLDRLESHGVLLYLNGDDHEAGQATRNGVHHVWCDNLNYAHTGQESYNLFRVYPDSVDLYRVFADGSSRLAGRLGR